MTTPRTLNPLPPVIRFEGVVKKCLTCPNEVFGRKKYCTTCAKVRKLKNNRDYAARLCGEDVPYQNKREKRAQPKNKSVCPKCEDTGTFEGRPCWVCAVKATSGDAFFRYLESPLGIEWEKQR